MGSQVELDRPARAYAAFARSAEAMATDRGGGSADELPFRTPLRRWISRGLARPDALDIDHHLSTLFPPVRPRRYLEIRYLDVQPDAWLDVPVTLLTTLLYDASARDAAIEVLGGDPTLLGGWWSRAAVDPGDLGLRSLAVELFAIGARRARALEPGSLPPDGPDLVEEYATRFLGHSVEIGAAA
jgi:glutamate--cysteine ligase